MISLLISFAVLIVGYLVYGKVTEKIFAPDNGFEVIWRYFSWSNQTLAMVALWVSSAFLLKKGRYRFGSLLTALPATFMTAVSFTYILIAKEGFRLNQTVSYIAGAVAAAVFFSIYLIALVHRCKRADDRLS